MLRGATKEIFVKTRTIIKIVSHGIKEKQIDHWMLTGGFCCLRTWKDQCLHRFRRVLQVPHHHIVIRKLSCNEPFPTILVSYGATWKTTSLVSCHKSSEIFLRIDFTERAHFWCQELTPAGTSWPRTKFEAILNSRPIAPVSDDPNDKAALSPAHSLLGDLYCLHQMTPSWLQVALPY